MFRRGSTWERSASKGGFIVIYVLQKKIEYAIFLLKDTIPDFHSKPFQFKILVYKVTGIFISNQEKLGNAVQAKGDSSSSMYSKKR